MKGSESGLPKISVISPSFNQGRFLEETIRSVITQGYPNLEYIIIDGGSTDNSVEIIMKHSDHLAYWVSEKDKGFGHAINKGFSRASGEILCWLNSDDILLPNALACVGHYFKENPSVGLVFGDRYFINEQSQILFKKKFFLYVKRQLRYAKTLPQESTFWTRKAFNDAGAYISEDLKFAIDLDLWCRLARVTRIEHIPIFLGAIRIHPETKSSTIKNLGRRERNKIIEEYYGSFPNKIQLMIFKWWMSTARRFYRILGFENRKLKKLLGEMRIAET